MNSIDKNDRSSGPQIEVINLTKTFNRVGGQVIRPVDNVSLDVAEHELVVLLGPSGCGKTTLLRCIAGLEKPDTGTIVVNGQVVFSSEKQIFVPANKRRLSMIFQSYALWPHMTVFENVAYPLESQGISKDKIRARVPEVLELVGIKGLEQQHPGRISGGQQQRVALARALVSNTRVMLFDEPLSNVDAQVRAQLRFELKKMQRAIKFAGVYVTHDQAEAMELGHRIAVLEAGKIVALDKPRVVYEDPGSEYVARFVGAANIWPGKIVSNDSNGVRIATVMGELVSHRSVDAAVGSEIAVMIRPESLRLSAHPSQVGEGIKVRVEARNFTGPHTEFVVQKDEAVARIWMREAEGLHMLEEGSDAWLLVDPARVGLIAKNSSIEQAA